MSGKSERGTSALCERFLAVARFWLLALSVFSQARRPKTAPANSAVFPRGN
jgi:hypothetical protein